MQNIQEVIVPVDFHQHTDDLAAFAVDVANKLGVKLTFLHVMGHLAGTAAYTEEYPTAFAAVDKELFDYAQKRMDELLEANKGRCTSCSGVVIRGDAADGIVDYVRENESELIIMATHGAKGIEKVLLGSVAERVLKRASCPVLIFNPYKGERGYQISAPINEIVEPV